MYFGLTENKSDVKVLSYHLINENQSDVKVLSLSSNK